MTNQYALGYKARLEAAVKVCHDIERKRWEVMRDGGSFVGWTPKDVAEAIAALPVPEVQWRDLTDEEIRDLEVLPDETRDRTPIEMAYAVIAKLKEKNGIV